MYQFSLEALLSHRKTIEESLQKELADLQRLRQEKINKRANFEKKREKIMIELEEKNGTGITAGYNIVYHNFIQRLNAGIDQQNQGLFEIGKEIENKRINLLDAAKNRKALEKLKEKRLQAYIRKLSHKEQLFMDEVAVNNFTGSVRLQNNQNDGKEV